VDGPNSVEFGTSVVGYYRLNTIKRVTNNFSEQNVIGKGGFGKVFKAHIGTIEVVSCDYDLIWMLY